MAAYALRAPASQALVRFAGLGFGELQEEAFGGFGGGGLEVVVFALGKGLGGGEEAGVEDEVQLALGGEQAYEFGEPLLKFGGGKVFGLLFGFGLGGGVGLGVIERGVAEDVGEFLGGLPFE